MKRIVLLFSILSIVVSVSAQTNYSEYLDKALKELEDGNCDAAQKFYNVYKELVGKTITSVEVLLADCGKAPTYKVGDYIMVGEAKYQVAYIRDGGKHGLAFQNVGWKPLSFNNDLYVTRKGVPTLDEMKLIYANRDLVQLYDIYWTCTEKASDNRYYATYDFSTGKIDYNYCYHTKGVILLIHRF